VHATRHVDDVPANRTDRVWGGNVVLALFALGWVVLIAVYLSHAIEYGSDSINNHVHVWWIARDLWHHGRLPWRFPLLGHGDAYAYPYGFVNWTTAALLWPLFGNWAVTLWTVVGSVGCIVATYVAFPELRRGYWAATVLANPAILFSLLFGQQSFAWASMLLLFGIALWRRGHRAWAAILIGVAQLTHPVIVGPIALVAFICYIIFTHDRWAAVRWYAVSCVMALPALWIVVSSPGYSDSSPGHQIVNFWATLGPRVLIVIFPMFFAVVRRLEWPWTAPFALLMTLGATIPLLFPLNGIAQIRTLTKYDVDTASLDAYLHSPNFVPGETYRVLRGGDNKLGLYHLVRAGGKLDSELFPESMAMHDFKSVAEYEQLLCDRHVDQIIRYDSYDTARHTNEHEVITELAARHGSPLTLVAHGPDYQIFTVDRSGCPAA
jgi:hypothetical protein